MPASSNLSQVFDRHRLSILRKLSLDRKQAEAHGQPHRCVDIPALSEEDELRHRQGTCNSSIRKKTSCVRSTALMWNGRDMTKVVSVLSVDRISGYQSIYKRQEIDKAA